MKLLLFDIDGTLLSAGGAGTRSLNSAFRDILCIENAFQGVNMAGKTDPLIVKEGLAKHGIPNNNGIVPQVLESYLAYLHTEIQTDKKHLKPGVPEALDALKDMPEYTVGLLTGNLEAGARIKLEAFGIYGSFLCGAFGSDHEDRNLLLPIAAQRFRERKQREIGFNKCVIIGDTPRDVACCKPYGAACIAVATGPYTRARLEKTEADVVMDDLGDTARFLNALKRL
ncbi:MAG TPA: HAD family hydrolase [Dissulfurispiraceae bacterium]|nr:HAD family hydrolase [Dissulfurispiraceae bacterium]